MSTSVSREHFHLKARDVKAWENFDAKHHRVLEKMGICVGLDDAKIRQMMVGMDAIQPTVTTGSIVTPAQFLQTWLPGVVNIVTAPRNIDELIGISTVGSWEDEEIVQTFLERTGYAIPYGDYTNVPRASWNANYERRTVVRFEQGMWVGTLDAARAAKANLDDAGTKRMAAIDALEIVRNMVGFYGFNNGANRTYGFLNDPNLPNYVTVANGAAGTPQWSTKTYLEIQKDILSAAIALQNGSQGLIDPYVMPTTLAVATASVGWLAKTSDFGNSVRQWMKETYPLMRLVSAPELNSANSSANVFYLYADQMRDRSTDDGRIWLQGVPAKLKNLGVQQLSKAYQEDFSNATSGAFCKRPWALVRRSGI